jgi:hypothetical protein
LDTYDDKTHCPNEFIKPQPEDISTIKTKEKGQRVSVKGVIQKVNKFETWWKLYFFIFGQVAQRVYSMVNGGWASSDRVPTLCNQLLSVAPFNWHSSNFVVIMMCMWHFGSVLTFFEKFTCSWTLSFFQHLVNGGYLYCVINSSHIFRLTFSKLCIIVMDSWIYVHMTFWKCSGFYRKIYIFLYHR